MGRSSDFLIVEPLFAALHAFSGRTQTINAKNYGNTAPVHLTPAHTVTRIRSIALQLFSPSALAHSPFSLSHRWRAGSFLLII